MTKIEAGKKYYLIGGGTFDVFHVGQKRAFGYDSVVGEISLSLNSFGEEVKSKRTLIGWVNIYNNKDGLKFGIPFEEKATADRAARSNKNWVDTIQISYTEK
jgi:hypothetical protein